VTIPETKQTKTQTKRESQEEKSRSTHADVVLTRAPLPLPLQSWAPIFVIQDTDTCPNQTARSHTIGTQAIFHSRMPCQAVIRKKGFKKGAEQTFVVLYLDLDLAPCCLGLENILKYWSLGFLPGPPFPQNRQIRLGLRKDFKRAKSLLPIPGLSCNVAEALFVWVKDLIRWQSPSFLAGP
jgi:hypothetical protein